MENDKDIQNLDDYVTLSSFADVEIGIAASKTINNVMEQVMHKIGQILSPVTYALLLCEKDSDQLYYKQVQGKGAENLKGYQLPKGEGLPSWIVQYKKSDFIEDVSKDSRYHKKIGKLLGYDVKTTLGVPFNVTDKTIGVFQLISRESGESYGAADLAVMETIVGYAAMAIEKIYYLSAMKDMDNIDAVTNVYKRRIFNQQFANEAERSKRYNQPLSLLIVKIDDFEGINNRHGLEAGDRILKDLASVLKKNVRRVDIVARYSVDEFAVLMPQTYKKNAELVMERFAKDIEKEGKKGDIPYSVSIGLGSAGAKDSLNLLEKTEKDFEKQKKTTADTAKKEVKPSKKSKSS